MNILVTDRDALTSQLLSTKLAALGHQVIVEPNKNAAFDMVRDGRFECIIVDPAPLSEPRPVIIGIWKNIRTPVKPYIMLLSKTATTEEAILAGTNDVLTKPFGTQDIELKMQNAMRLMDISLNLAHEDNVHSSGGMVGKAAFNQLFLSAIDRSFRYGERSLIVFAEVTNYNAILSAHGQDGVDETIRKLVEKMTFMRRQSDVIGRLSACDFGILLQRPQYESEPLDAINRFAETMDKFYNSFTDKTQAPHMHFVLVELPQGAQHAERFSPMADKAAQEG